MLKLSRRSFAYSFCAVILLQLLMGVVLFSGSASAQLNYGNPGVARNLERITVFIERCSEGRLSTTHNTTSVRLANNISVERASRGELFHIHNPRTSVTATYTGEHEVRMSSALFNGQMMQCQSSSLSGQAIDAIYGSRRVFLEKFYDLVQNEWQRKDEWTSNSNLVREMRRDAVGIGFYTVKGGGQYPRDTLAGRYTNFRPYFERCFEPRSSQGSAEYIVTSYNQPRRESQIISGQAETDLYPGLLYARLSENPTASENMDCLSFAAALRSNPYYFREVFLTIPEITQAGSQQNEQSIRADLVALLTGNQAVMAVCLAGSSSPSTFTSLPPATLAREISDAIINNQGSIEYSSGGDTYSLNALSTAFIKKCYLESELGGRITEITGRTFDEDGYFENTMAETEQEEDNSCTTNSGALGWIMCPIAGMLDSVVGFMDQEIQEKLILKDDYFQGESGAKLKQAWTQLRNIAYIILIPVMLVMVIGTALNFEIFSAYTIKKALPRMVIAIIFITLSWYICLFLVNFANVVGTGIKGLVTAPFGITTDVNQSPLKGALTSAEIVGQGSSGLESGLSGATVGALGIMGIGGIFTAGYLSVPILMSLLGTAALILGGVFLLLIARQMILIGLFLVAPLAIIAWIFPGNDKLWKYWWGGFTKLLMLFPVIMLLIGAGQIFAQVAGISRSGAGDNMLVTIIIIVAAFVMPFFFIPFAFKWAGGLFGNLAGIVNDREKGVLDRLKKGRGEERARLKERAGSNNRFSNRNRLSRFGNTVGSWGADPLNTAAYYGRNLPGLSARGQKVKSAIEGQASEETGKLFQELNEKFKFNDKAYRALSGSFNGFEESTRDQLVQSGLATYMLNEDGSQMLDEKGRRMVNGKAPTNLKQFQDVAKALSSSSSASEQIASNVLNGAAGRLSSLYTDPEMGKASTQAAGILGLSAHGFASGDDLAYVGNNMMDQGVSAELAQSFVNGAQVAGQRQRPDIKAGYGTVFSSDKNGENGKFINGLSDEGGRAQELVKTLTSADLAGAKSGAIKALTPAIGKMLDEGGGNAQAVTDQLISWAGPYSQASVDVKAEALNIIASRQELKKEFDRRRNADIDPAARNEFGPAGAEGEDG